MYQILLHKQIYIEFLVRNLMFLTSKIKKEFIKIIKLEIEPNTKIYKD